MEHNKWLQTYLFIWVGQFISTLTSYAVQFAIVIWLSLEYQSAEVLAYAGIAGMLPQAVIGPLAALVMVMGVLSFNTLSLMRLGKTIGD